MSTNHQSLVYYPIMGVRNKKLFQKLRTETSMARLPVTQIPLPCAPMRVPAAVRFLDALATGNPGVGFQNFGLPSLGNLQILLASVPGE